MANRPSYFQAVEPISERKYRHTRVFKAAGILGLAFAGVFLLTSSWQSGGPQGAGAPSTARDELEQDLDFDDKTLDDAALKRKAAARLELLVSKAKLASGEEDLRIPSPLSDPSTGIFTGHSHRRKGSKLSFGVGTYFNVFNPNPDQSDCDPGQYGGRTCNECPPNFYCPDGTHKFACAANSISMEGSHRASDCYCAPGKYGQRPSRPGEVLVCRECHANSYCPGGAVVQPCPAHSASEPGSFVCTCKAGYYGTDMATCAACPVGSWCPGGEASPRSCPLKASSGLANDDVSKCTCIAGFYQTGGQSVGEVPTCFECPKDMYCPGGRQEVMCPIGSGDNRGSASMRDCKCSPGYYGGDPTNCMPCPVDHFCPEKSDRMTATRCPQGTHSRLGSALETDCQCDAGTYGSTPRECSRCPANSFCKGGAQIEPCPVNSMSEQGNAQCRCKEGFYGSDPRRCSQCPAGSFCPGGADKMACPPHTVSIAGAQIDTDCLCVAGYSRGQAGTCDKCPAGTYCKATGGEPEACPANSNSPKGSVSARACECEAGYSQYSGSTLVPKGDAGPTCNLCNPGYFCTGGSRQTACAFDSTSQEGATSVADCECKEGYFGQRGTCRVCAAGFFCDGGEGQQSCAAHATSSRGAAKASECHCEAGYYGEHKDCKVCPAGFVCSMGKMVKCPKHTTSKAGDIGCSCEAGYYGDDPSRCRLCTANSFCPGGGDRLACPAHSTSAEGAESSEDCKGEEGYRALRSEQSVEFVACPAGSYCPGGGHIRSCPETMYSRPGADSEAACACREGFRDSDKVPDVNYVWDLRGKVHIKMDGRYYFCTSSDDGSKMYLDGRLIGDDDGLHGPVERCSGWMDFTSGQVLDVRVVGFQCGGGIYQRVFWTGPGFNRASLEVRNEDAKDGEKDMWKMQVWASSRNMDRVPSDDQLRTFRDMGTGRMKIVEFNHVNDLRKYIKGECLPCKVGYYCPGAFNDQNSRPKNSLSIDAPEYQCPGRSWTYGEKTLSRDGCDACGPGYLGPNSGSCTSCQEGFYCPGGKVQLRCPVGTTSSAGRKAVEECVCDVGYMQVDSRDAKPWLCKPCTADYYCPNTGGTSAVKCTPGSKVAEGAGKTWQDCKCDAGYYKSGNSACVKCQSNFYCPGGVDGNNRYSCPAFAESQVESSERSDCKCPHLEKNYPDVVVSVQSACQKYNCRTASKCTFQRMCDNDATCRGFEFVNGNDEGYGCLIKGLSQCIKNKEPSPNDLYLRKPENVQPDSVALMRTLGLTVPVCAANGPEISFDYSCDQNNGGSLPVGSWGFVSWERCDDDLSLCQKNSCRIHRGYVQRLKNIPAGYKVIMYTQPNFEGESVTLMGALADQCLTSVRDERSRSFLNRMQSVKIVKVG